LTIFTVYGLMQQKDIIFF